MEKIELTGGHIGILLFIEVENLEFPGGHIEFMLFIEMYKQNYASAILE